MRIKKLNIKTQVLAYILIVSVSLFTIVIIYCFSFKTIEKEKVLNYITTYNDNKSKGGDEDKKNSNNVFENVNFLEKTTNNARSSFNMLKDRDTNNNVIKIAEITIESIGIIDKDVVEGTSEYNLKSNITHFECSPMFSQNVCLAAHNYSIQNNLLFSTLKNISFGDVIKYKTIYGTKRYIVKRISVISSKDLSVLKQNTNESLITLITCVNYDINLRLCVKAYEEV